MATDGDTDTRKAILDAAVAVADEKGFEAASVRAIAERAGVGVGTIGYCFGSKANAIAEAYRSVTDELRSAFKALEAPGTRGEEALRGFAGGLAAAVRKHGKALAYFTRERARGVAFPPEYGDFARDTAPGLAAAAMSDSAPEVSEREAAMRLSAFAGALLYPSLVRRPLGLDLDDEDAWAEYASLCAGLLTPARHNDRKER